MFFPKMVPEFGLNKEKSRFDSNYDFFGDSNKNSVHTIKKSKSRITM